MSVVPIPDLGALSLREAWDLEDNLDEARDLLREHIDAEIRRLAGEGWTQTRIAGECGRTQGAVSKRMSRLGIEPAGQGRPRVIPGNNSEPEPDDAEVLDGEIVSEEQEQDMAPASRAQAVDLAERGMSYRQIGQELGVDESLVRRDPVVREARLKGDPDAHSTVNGSSVACRVESPSELITRIRQDHERILSRTYTLGSADQKALHKTLVKTTRRLEEMMQDA